jgi:hypothetical protein
LLPEDSEERREVGVNHDGDDPVVLDLDRLENQSREIVPLLWCRRLPCRREVAEERGCPGE